MAEMGVGPEWHLDKNSILADFELLKPQTDAKIMFVHRKLAQGDIYWINNRSNRSEKIDAIFRVQGLAAEIWHPDTGKIEPTPYRIEGKRTSVSMQLDPIDAMFVVFRKPAKQLSLSIAANVETPVATLEGPWDVSFQPDRGAPEKIVLNRLSSWAENADSGVKYFSGTGTYIKTIRVDSNWLSNNTRLWLDLGSVHNIAEVAVNGESLGILWKAPFRIDVTEALKAGSNALEVKVTNLWVNRLIGDPQPSASKKFTYTTQQFYRADSPLKPSGLLGPVRIVQTAF
jgi:hypothetical protein